MNEVTRDFINIAYKALEKAYWYESEKMTKNNTELALEIGAALQAVGDLSRHE